MPFHGAKSQHSIRAGLGKSDKLKRSSCANLMSYAECIRSHVWPHDADRSCLDAWSIPAGSRRSAHPTGPDDGRAMPHPVHVLDLIGHTPLVELHGFDTGACRLLVKLESHNPGGSIKDRIGRSMIEAA